MALTKAQREALPDSAFAVPGKRSFPLVDERHVMMARAQFGNATGLTDDERADGRAAIQARAAELGIDTSGWDTIRSLKLEAMALTLPDVVDHPNRMPFSGVLVHLDQPSDAAPHGSKGKLVVMSASAAEAALPSLIGMAVDFTPDFDGHDAQRKIGVITGATIEGSDLRIEGFLYASDFPTEAATIKADKSNLGFSFEAQQIHVESLDTDPLVITACVFTGAAILKKNKAAFTTTSLAASANAGEIDMTKEELEAILAAALKPVTDKIATIEASQTEMAGKIEAGKDLHAKVAPHADKLRACATGMQAAGVGLHATRGHVALLNRMADGMEAEAMGGSMPHIFRDHDYAGGSYMASSDEKTVEKPAADPAIAALKDEVANLGTKLTDAIAAGRADAPAPERKTLAPAITSLLAKAGIDAPDGAEKMSVQKLDQILAASSLGVSERIRVKQELYRAGSIDA